MTTQNQDRHSLSSRRAFLKGAFFSAGAAVAAPTLVRAETKTAAEKPSAAPRPDEWRNKQAGMAYRRLGRTGFMISEMVLGGSGPLNNPEKVRDHLEAIERGVNYLDSSTRYHRGASEEGWGVLLSEPGMRDKVFVATKLAEYDPAIDRLTREIFEGLPSEKKHALQKKAATLAGDIIANISSSGKKDRTVK